MLTLKNIKKIYEQSDEAVLDDINLTFNRDEFVSILGCSGAGKSTLLNIIGGLDCKTSGKLLINGKDIYKYSDSNLDYYRKNNNIIEVDSNGDARLVFKELERKLEFYD